MFQLSRYYRHGELDSCDEKWSDLWECFAVKRAQREGLPAPERRAARARAEECCDSYGILTLWIWILIVVAARAVVMFHWWL